MGNFVEFTRTFTRITHKPDKTCLGLNFNENSRNFFTSKNKWLYAFFLLKFEYYAQSLFCYLNSSGEGGEKVTSVPFGHTPVST